MTDAVAPPGSLGNGNMNASRQCHLALSTCCPPPQNTRQTARRALSEQASEVRMRASIRRERTRGGKRRRNGRRATYYSSREVDNEDLEESGPPRLFHEPQDQTTKTTWRLESGGRGGVVGDKNCESGWNWNRAEEASFADLFGCWWAKLPATKSRGVNEPTFHAFCLLARLSTHTYGL